MIIIIIMMKDYLYDQFLVLEFDINGLTLDYTFLNLDNLKLLSSIYFFLLDYLDGLVPTYIFGAYFLLSYFNNFNTAYLYLFNSSSC